jgi:hypothetical protein
MALLSAAVASCHLQKLSQENQCSPMPIWTFFVSTAAVWLKSLLGCLPQSCPACSAAHRDNILGSLLGSPLPLRHGWSQIQRLTTG